MESWALGDEVYIQIYISQIIGTVQTVLWTWDRLGTVQVCLGQVRQGIATRNKRLTSDSPKISAVWGAQNTKKFGRWTRKGPTKKCIFRTCISHFL